MFVFIPLTLATARGVSFMIDSFLERLCGHAEGFQASLGSKLTHNLYQKTPSQQQWQSPRGTTPLLVLFRLEVLIMMMKRRRRRSRLAIIASVLCSFVLTPSIHGFAIVGRGAVSPHRSAACLLALTEPQEGDAVVNRVKGTKTTAAKKKKKATKKTSTKKKKKKAAKKKKKKTTAKEKEMDNDDIDKMWPITREDGIDYWKDPQFDRAVLEYNDQEQCTLLRFTVRGNPQPLRRHRTTKGYMYNPSAKAQECFQNVVLDLLPKEFRVLVVDNDDDNDIDAPTCFGPDELLCMSVVFRMRRPKSHFRSGRPGPGRLQPKHQNGGWGPIRTDVDNLAKFVLDSLNGLAYRDDCQIVSLHATKLYDNADPYCDGSIAVSIQPISQVQQHDNNNNLLDDLLLLQQPQQQQQQQKPQQ